MTRTVVLPAAGRARLRPIDGGLRVDEGFWGERLATNRQRPSPMASSSSRIRGAGERNAGRRSGRYIGGLDDAGITFPSLGAPWPGCRPDTSRRVRAIGVHDLRRDVLLPGVLRLVAQDPAGSFDGEERLATPHLPGERHVGVHLRHELRTRPRHDVVGGGDDAHLGAVDGRPRAPGAPTAPRPSRPRSSRGSTSAAGRPPRSPGRPRSPPAP